MLFNPAGRVSAYSRALIFFCQFALKSDRDLGPATFASDMLGGFLLHIHTPYVLRTVFSKEFKNRIQKDIKIRERYVLDTPKQKNDLAGFEKQLSRGSSAEFRGETHVSWTIS